VAGTEVLGGEGMVEKRPRILLSQKGGITNQRRKSQRKTVVVTNRGGHKPRITGVSSLRVVEKKGTRGRDGSNGSEKAQKKTNNAESHQGITLEKTHKKKTRGISKKGGSVRHTGYKQKIGESVGGQGLRA